MRMGKRKVALAAMRAWNLLRLALLRARKRGALKRGLVGSLRLVPSYLRGLRTGTAAERGDVVRYAEREFSFNETPVFHRLRCMRGIRMPCVNPHIDLEDGGVDDDGGVFLQGRDGRVTWVLCRCDTNRDEQEEEEEERGEEEIEGEMETKEEEEEGKCIDLKAEEFIAKFYEQMKLQRQVSILQ